jgi:hypothetical protein
MRKSGIPTPTPGHQGTPPRSRRIRNRDGDPPDPADLAEPAPQNALKRTKKAHFLEPYRLSEAGRAALLQCLTDRAVGDPDSRELFAAAVEYGIAGCRATTAKDSRPPAKTPVAVEPVAPPTAPLATLAETARLLARELDALDTPSRDAIAGRLRTSDPFDRLHDHAYLDAVRREVARIAEAAFALLDAAPASSTPALAPASAEPSAPDDSLGETARRLARRIADAYESCFETKVETAAGSPFIPVLRLVAAEAGIAMPAEDTRVCAVLARR